MVFCFFFVTLGIILAQSYTLSFGISIFKNKQTKETNTLQLGSLCIWLVPFLLLWHIVASVTFKITTLFGPSSHQKCEPNKPLLLYKIPSIKYCIIEIQIELSHSMPSIYLDYLFKDPSPNTCTFSGTGVLGLQHMTWMRDIINCIMKSIVCRGKKMWKNLMRSLFLVSKV